MNLVLTKIESNNEEGFEPHPHPPQKAKTTPTHPRSSHKLYNCVRAPKGVIFEPISAEMDILFWTWASLRGCRLKYGHQARIWVERICVLRGAMNTTTKMTEKSPSTPHPPPRFLHTRVRVLQGALHTITKMTKKPNSTPHPRSTPHTGKGFTRRTAHYHQNKWEAPHPLPTPHSTHTRVRVLRGALHTTTKMTEKPTSPPPIHPTHGLGFYKAHCTLPPKWLRSPTQLPTPAPPHTRVKVLRGAMHTTTKLNEKAPLPSRSPTPPTHGLGFYEAHCILPPK